MKVWLMFVKKYSVQYNSVLVHIEIKKGVEEFLLFF